MGCLFHKWNWCTCSKCGKTRENHHDLNGCKCSICNKIRDEQHNWDGCKCTICGKIRNEQHNWDGCECTRCGADKHTWRLEDRSGGGVDGSGIPHGWLREDYKCTSCGKTRVDEYSE